MELGKLRQGHGAELDHGDGFVESGLLRGGGQGAEGGEVEVLASGENVLADQPVGRDDLVEPGEAALVGVAAVAVLFEDVADFGGRCELGCLGLYGNVGAEELQQYENYESDKDQPGKNQSAENFHRDLCLLS